MAQRRSSSTTVVNMRPVTEMKTEISCYDAPRYWDLAFSDETDFEADFIQSAALKYLGTDSPTILEIGCGGGRQVVELARRGLDVTAFDLEPACIRFTQSRLKRLGLKASVFRADMADFTFPRRNPAIHVSDCNLVQGDTLHFPLPNSIDVAHCFVNTFRHLSTEFHARTHLECVAAALKPGGIYLLGFHLLPPDASEEDCERWTVMHRGTRVTTTVRVLAFSRRMRLETVRFSLKVTTPKKVLRFSSDHQLRIYRADQFLSLLDSVPKLRLLAVFDFCYDLSEPLPLDNRLGDAVFVLQKRS